ncbi:hypothetical protein HMPREF9418_1697 [Neisseria macacae ATCC 33926]|uniref:Uncharacterized protein n=1 Tax=Neisseria macacae ATCC 33926 TaxID=997348 RepID=A0AA36UJ57_9NEIS|nr:hypothetical protein HMPREF9418_1697 [Neisseria macacae ATCC 33926]
MFQTAFRPVFYMKYRIIRNALRQTKGRLKQGFDFAKTVFQTTLMARNPSIIYSF